MDEMNYTPEDEVLEQENTAPKAETENVDETAATSAIFNETASEADTEEPVPAVRRDVALKEWSYTEKNEKCTIKHTLSLTKDRLVHRAENNESKQAVKQRTDIALRNVHSVNASYGYTRNLGLAVLLGILSFLALVGGIVCMTQELPAAIFVVLFVVAVGFGVGAYLVYRKVKPSFVLEICTIGTITSDLLAYGNSASGVTRQHRRFPFFRLILIAAIGVGAYFLVSSGVLAVRIPGMNNIYVIIAAAVLALILLILPRPHASSRSVGKVSSSGGSYRFEMDAETGNDIVETIGELIIENQLN